MSAAQRSKRLERIEALAARLDARPPAWASPVDLAAALGIALDPWQRAALTSQAARLIVLGPRQCGKSTVAALLSLFVAITVPESLTLLIAPAQRQSMELARTVRRLAARLGLATAERTDVVTPAMVSASRIEFGSGSRIIALPGASEATVRGYAQPALIVVDEAARLSEETFAAIRPALAANPAGRLVLISTPWQKAGTFWRTWTGASPAWERIRVRLEDVPRYSAAFLAEERASLPAWVFAREYLGEFADDETTLFPAELVGAAFDASVQPLFGGSQ